MKWGYHHLRKHPYIATRVNSTRWSKPPSLGVFQVMLEPPLNFTWTLVVEFPTHLKNMLLKMGTYLPQMYRGETRKIVEVSPPSFFTSPLTIGNVPQKEIIKFIFQALIFRGKLAVSFREGNFPTPPPKKKDKLENPPWMKMYSNSTSYLKWDIFPCHSLVFPGVLVV